MTYEHQEWPKWLFRADGSGRSFRSQEDADAFPGGPWLTRDELAQVKVKVKAPVDPPGSHDQTPIPDDWRDLKWFALRSLASKLTNAPVNDKADAVAAIEAALKRRA